MNSRSELVLAGATGTQTSYALDPRFCFDTLGGRGEGYSNFKNLADLKNAA